MVPEGIRAKDQSRGTDGRSGLFGPNMEMQQVATGTVKWFNSEKGFGFILPDEGGRDLFVHRSNVETNGHVLHDGEKVQYELGQGRKGPEATRVRGM